MNRLAPPPGQVALGHGARSPGIMGKTPLVKGVGGHHEHFEMENLEFHSKLNYILYILVTKSRTLGNSGLDSDSGVRESIWFCRGFGRE